MAPKEKSINAAIASVITELEFMSSFKEEQKMALKAFIDRKDAFILLLIGFGSLIYQPAPLVALSYYIIWFVELIG